MKGVPKKEKTPYTQQLNKTSYKSIFLLEKKNVYQKSVNIHLSKNWCKNRILNLFHNS